jgi:signal transduction histidine kinase
VVRRAVRSCAALCRDREVQIEAEVPEELPPVEMDGVRVEQALQNLMANAVQHSPRGSTVWVRGKVDEGRDEPGIRCTVDDEGPGLPEGESSRIFEPFFSRRKGGTGLGLCIVQRVAEAHGGEVTAENRPGAGARFTLVLPLAGGASVAAGGGDA